MKLIIFYISNSIKHQITQETGKKKKHPINQKQEKRNKITFPIHPTTDPRKNHPQIQFIAPKKANPHTLKGKAPSRPGRGGERLKEREREEL